MLNSCTTIPLKPEMTFGKIKYAAFLRWTMWTKEAEQRRSALKWLPSKANWSKTFQSCRRESWITALNLIADLLTRYTIQIWFVLATLQFLVVVGGVVTRVQVFSWHAGHGSMTAFILGDRSHRSSPIINPGWAPAQVAAEGVLLVLLATQPPPWHAGDAAAQEASDSASRTPWSKLIELIRKKKSLFVVVWPTVIPANAELPRALLCTSISYRGPGELNIWGSIPALVGWRQSISPSLFAGWPGAWRCKPARSSARKRWNAHKTADVSPRPPLSEREETGLTVILATCRL